MTVREHNIQLPMQQIEDFCRRNPIQKLSIFGSALRDDFREQSDVDLLLELTPDSGVGFFKLMEMQFELEEMIKRKVDLRTIHDFPERLKKNVLDSAEVLYVRE